MQYAVARKKKKLTGKEAEDYIKANNPKKGSYTVTSNPKKIDTKQLYETGQNEKIQKERDSRGLVGNVVYDIGKSISAAPRALLASKQGTTQGILDTEESRRFEDDPYKFGLQSIANTASFFVPAFGIGGNIGKAAIGAGASGLLQSAGNQDLRGGKSLDAGKLATDAIVSGGFGAGLSAVGGAIARRAKTPVFDEAKGAVMGTIERKARNANLASKGMQEIPASAGGSLNAPRAFNESADRITAGLAEFGNLPRNERGFGVLADKIGERTKGGILAMKVSAEAPEFIDNVVEEALRYIPGVSRQEVQDSVVSYVRNLVDTGGLLNGASLDNAVNMRAALGSEPLYAMKQATQGFVGGGRPTDIGSAIGKAVHDVSGKILGSDTTPILNELGQQVGTLGGQYTNDMRLFADLFQQQDGMINRNPFMTSDGDMTIGSIAGGITTKAKDLATRGVERAAGGIGNLPRISKVLDRLNIQNPMARTIAGNTLATGQARPPQGMATASPTGTQGEETTSDTGFKSFYGLDQEQGTTPQTSELEFYQYFRSQGVNDTQARYMAGAAYEDQLASNPIRRKKKLTSIDRTAKTRAEFGLEGTYQMRQFLQNEVNLGDLALQGILPQFMKSSDAQKFKVVSDKIADAITRAMTGAALNESEIAFYNRQIPVFGDTPETIDYKLSSLEEFFQSMYPDEFEDVYK